MICCEFLDYDAEVVCFVYAKLIRLLGHEENRKQQNKPDRDNAENEVSYFPISHSHLCVMFCNHVSEQKHAFTCQTEVCLSSFLPFVNWKRVIIMTRALLAVFLY